MGGVRPGKGMMGFIFYVGTHKKGLLFHFCRRRIYFSTRNIFVLELCARARALVCPKTAQFELLHVGVCIRSIYLFIVP